MSDKNYGYVSDRDRVRKAFAALRRKGYIARMNFSCCTGCGVYEIGEKVLVAGGDPDTAKYVFYHRQEHDRTFAVADDLLDRKLHLAWGGDPAEIVSALRAAGLRAEHDGNPNLKIEVRGVA